MKCMRRAVIVMMALVSVSTVFAAGKKKTKKSSAGIVASTSWTAAFADLAGVDEVTVIAPASLRHPPEYEVTVSDIQTINAGRIFIYAGFERMMKTLGNTAGGKSSGGNTQMVQITCDNSIATVTQSAGKIAAVTGTQKEMEARVAEYASAVRNAAAALEEKGLKGAKVLCNKNQTYLAKELGLDVAAVFGPGPVTAGQIADAKSGGYVFIIDNVHNPVGQPLAEVAPDSSYIIWRNFPEETGRNALLNVVLQNILQLQDGPLK